MMLSVLALSFFAMISGASAGACTPQDSCPKLSDGLYCPVNDVTEHADINRDVKLIKDRLAEKPPNYAQAKEVYTNGASSSKGAGIMRTLQDLATKDMTVGGKYNNTFYSGAVDLYGSANAVWEDLMTACFDDTGFCKDKTDDFRTYVLNKGCIGIVTAYATYEMGAAVWKAANGETEDGKAPYAWDEAAAFYIGNIDPVVGDGYTGKAPGNLYSPYEFNWKRDGDFPDGSSTHADAVPILNHGLKSLRGSDYDAAEVGKAQTAMYKVFSIAAIRSAIKYSWKAYGGGNFSDKYLAEGSIYWRTASGYLSTVNKSIVQEIDALLGLSQTSISADVPCHVKTKVEALYSGLGIDCGMVGTWKDAPADSCLASSCSSSGGTLLAGDKNYVDMCKATSPTPSPVPSPSPSPTPADMSDVSAAAASAGLAGAFAAAVLATLA